MQTQDFPTARQFAHAIADIENEYGKLEATGTLVTMYNRLRAAGVDSGELFDYVDAQLELAAGQWAMDRGGYLYMV